MGMVPTDMTKQDGPTLNQEQLVEDGKKLMADEIARYQEETMKYLQRYVEPHKIKSRWVTPEDMEYVVKEAQVCLQLCFTNHGMYGNANAIAHPQIEDKSPLRFFVMRTGMVIVNPIIVSHTKYPITKERGEGCMSYPSEPFKPNLQRFNKVDVQYQTLSPNPDGKPESLPVLSASVEGKFNGEIAQVFQHECAHLNGHYIYDEDYSPLHAVGFGDGSDFSKAHVIKISHEDNTQGESETSA